MKRTRKSHKQKILQIQYFYKMRSNREENERQKQNFFIFLKRTS